MLGVDRRCQSWAVGGGHQGPRHLACGQRLSCLGLQGWVTSLFSSPTARHYVAHWLQGEVKDSGSGPSWSNILGLGLGPSPRALSGAFQRF